MFHDFPRPGETSELVGNDEVRVVGPDGSVLARRERPRLVFSGARRQFYWDHLDFVYFGAYATWNYLVTPFLFLRKGFSFEALPPVQTPARAWSRVRVTFPADLPTHSATQDFYFDEHHLLRRLDYTAEVVGGWAHAAHICEQTREFDGLQVSTHRTVKPCRLGRVRYRFRHWWPSKSTISACTQPRRFCLAAPKSGEVGHPLRLRPPDRRAAGRST